MKIPYKIIYLGICTSSLIACTGGSGDGSSNAQTNNNPPISSIQLNPNRFVADSAPGNALSGSSCVVPSIDFPAGGNQYYQSINISLQNNCDQDIDISNNYITWVSQDANAAFVPLNASSWWGQVGNNWSPAVTDLGLQANNYDMLQLGLGNLVIPAHATAILSSGYNMPNGSNLDFATAKNTIQFQNTQPNPPTGELTISIDAYNVSCSQDCDGANLSIVNSHNIPVGNYPLDSKLWGHSEQVSVESLAVDNYTVTINNIPNGYNDTVNPNPAKVSANTNTPVGVSFTAIPKTGTLTLDVPNSAQFSGFGQLPGSFNIIVTNIKDKKSTQVYAVNVGGSSSITLPISDASHQYRVVYPDVVDPILGQAYSPTAAQYVVIKQNNATVVNPAYALSAKVTLDSVNANINGLNYGDQATVSFSSSKGVIYASDLFSQNSQIKLEDKDVTGITVLAPQSPKGSYQVNVTPSSLLVANNQSFNATFTWYKNTQVVAGWPNYIAMGTVTDDQTDGLDSRPVDAIFKYAGDGGNGDPGRIVFPIYTIETTALANTLKTSAKHVVVPTMVVYTAQMSGGASFTDFEGDTLNKHFVNLALISQVMEQNSTTANPSAGSLVINPDLMGMVQQENLLNNGLGSMDIKVNTAAAIANCFIKHKFAYDGGSYTALQIAQKMKVYSWWDVKTNWEAAAEQTYYPYCIANPDTSGVPTFSDDFPGWIQANNWIIQNYGPHVTYGWQENLWQTGSSNWIHKLNAVNQIQTQITNPTIALMKQVHLFDGTYKPNFIVFDRYEMDDTAAAGTGYFYNDQDWNNYLTFISQMTAALDLPAMLWQIPGADIMTQAERNQDGMLTGSSAAPYFFGEPDIGNRLSNVTSEYNTDTLANNAPYACASGSNCTYISYLTQNGYDWTKNNGKLATAASAHVFSILWGGGQTTSVGTFPHANASSQRLANNIIQYYKNPQPLIAPQ